MRLRCPLPGVPLWPCSSGATTSRRGVIGTVRRAALQLGQPLQDAGGLWLHSGHALRVTGAQGLSRAGLGIHAIQVLGRWGSDAVLLYIRNAPLYATHKYAAAALAG